MDYSDVSELRYATEDKTAIDCKVRFVGIDEVFPFTATPEDPTEYGVKIFAEAVAGKWGEIAEYSRSGVAAAFQLNLAETMKSDLMAKAEAIIAPLARAVKYGIATEDEGKKLEALERYTVLLNRVDPENPEWPPAV